MNIIKRLELLFFFVIISFRNLYSEMGKPNNELHCECVCCCYYPVADWKIKTSNTEAFKKKKKFQTHGKIFQTVIFLFFSL